MFDINAIQLVIGQFWFKRGKMIDGRNWEDGMKGERNRQLPQIIFEHNL